MSEGITFSIFSLINSLSREDIEIFGFSKELRERANYDAHQQFEKLLTEQAREQTVNFVNKIRFLLK